MQEESVDVRETRNAEHYGALIHHLSLIRNKRCLMAYV
jgi:GINS complex subunit 1